MERDRNVCEQHHMHFEMFCCEQDCNKEEEPMCPICMCEHMKKHRVKATHIREYVDSGLEKVKKGREKLKEHQVKIQEYHDTAEEYLKNKDKVQAQLEAILQRLLNLVKHQQGLATDTNREMLNCHEETAKAIKQCEHKLKEKINDPEGVKTQIEAMVKDRNYLTALDVIHRVIKEDSRLEDTDIVRELDAWKKHLTNYQKQLQELDITPAQLADYKKIYEENGRLTNENNRLTSIWVLLTRN